MDNEKTNITVEATIDAAITRVWDYWTEPEHIKNWNNASDDWHTPDARNDLQAGGEFSYRMEAKDGSFGFDFAGVYDEVIELRKINYTLADDRKVSIDFAETADGVNVTETFEAESMNSVELQRAGWQAILDNFKKYVDSAS
jgi:uncharacterized protein YndB with AHSA1/START domain